MKKFITLLIALSFSACAFAQDNDSSTSIGGFATSFKIVDSTGAYWYSDKREGYYEYSDEWCINRGDVVSVYVEPFRFVIEKEYIDYDDWNTVYLTQLEWNHPSIIQKGIVSVHRRWKLVYVVKEGKIALDRVIRANVTMEKIVPQHIEPAKIEWPE